MSEKEDSRIVGRPSPRMRKLAVDFIEGLYCIQCSWREECSAEEGEREKIHKCPKLEEWVMKVYEKWHDKIIDL